MCLSSSSRKPLQHPGLAARVSATRRWLCRGEGAVHTREKHAKNHFTRGTASERVKGRQFELRRVSKEMLQDNSICLEIQVFPR